MLNACTSKCTPQSIAELKAAFEKVCKVHTWPLFLHVGSGFYCLRSISFFLLCTYLRKMPAPSERATEHSQAWSSTWMFIRDTI